MKKAFYFSIVVAIIMLGCINSGEHYAVFDYEDFGPQAMAWEKIGMQWWQWDSIGGSDPDYKYDIKVVVYNKIPLDQIKTLFAVNESKRKDFRYFEYHDSIRYLDEQISNLEKDTDEWAVSLKARLVQTKELIQQKIK